MGVAAMVFGILGVVTCWVPGVGILFGLTGAVLGLITLIKKTEHKGFGIIGMVLGGVALIICAIVSTLAFLAADAGLDALGDYQQRSDAASQQPFNP